MILYPHVLKRSSGSTFKLQYDINTTRRMVSSILISVHFTYRIVRGVVNPMPGASPMGFGNTIPGAKMIPMRINQPMPSLQ